jgi:hypothetical protein
MYICNKIALMKNTEENKNTTPYDILGISSATLCLIHCILFPLFALIPFGFSEDYLVDTFFACIGMLVVSKILMSNATSTVKIILGISVILIVLSVLLEIVFDIHSGLIFVGGIGMIIGHILNFKSHKHS